MAQSMYNLISQFKHKQSCTMYCKGMLEHNNNNCLDIILKLFLFCRIHRKRRIRKIGFIIINMRPNTLLNSSVYVDVTKNAFQIQNSKSFERLHKLVLW